MRTLLALVLVLAPALAQGITLQYWHINTEAFGLPAVRELIREFERRNPGIKRVDAVTGGNHSFDPPDLEEVLGHPRVLRPLNHSPLAPGRGSLLLEKGGKRLLVVNVAGRSALPRAVEEPLPALERLLAEGEGVPVLVDFHSESVFEKMAAAYALDGRIAALLGTHTHVPTADARILPRGTAYVSDVGMVGAEGGLQGYYPAFLVAAFRLRLPPKGLRLAYAEGPARVSYVFLELEGARAKAIVHASFVEEAFY
ncbi:hypothetical protein SAMN04488243_13523 [Thermus arciformis]|uniref:Metallophosphoesterase n=1 Tax=Thermus arciformis TaxID=482827 RepID=A0A1G7JKK6_9DEIN|nr:YmdB family metallophosphoesterase [Thermus arciformis]SDF25423.1 hypothetical protein SAMN04488243_13523 [Thermus arciformis]